MRATTWIQNVARKHRIEIKPAQLHARSAKHKLVKVARDVTCSSRTMLAAIKPDRRGRVTVLLPRPAAGAIASYRLVVAAGRTVTLPVIVAPAG